MNQPNKPAPRKRSNFWTGLADIISEAAGHYVKVVTEGYKRGRDA